MCGDNALRVTHGIEVFRLLFQHLLRKRLTVQQVIAVVASPRREPAQVGGPAQALLCDAFAQRLVAAVLAVVRRSTSASASGARLRARTQVAAVQLVATLCAAAPFGQNPLSAPLCAPTAVPYILEAAAHAPLRSAHAMELAVWFCAIVATAASSGGAPTREALTSLPVEGAPGVAGLLDVADVLGTDVANYIYGLKFRAASMVERWTKWAPVVPADTPIAPSGAASVRYEATGAAQVVVVSSLVALIPRLVTAAAAQPDVDAEAERMDGAGASGGDPELRQGSRSALWQSLPPSTESAAVAGDELGAWWHVKRSDIIAAPPSSHDDDDGDGDGDGGSPVPDALATDVAVRTPPIRCCHVIAATPRENRRTCDALRSRQAPLLPPRNPSIHRR